MNALSRFKSNCSDTALRRPKIGSGVRRGSGILDTGFQIAGTRVQSTTSTWGAVIVCDLAPVELDENLRFRRIDAGDEAEIAVEDVLVVAFSR